MVLYTWELRGEPQTIESNMGIQLRKVDMLHAEQIEQWFLCDINALGQVREALGLFLLLKCKLTFYFHRFLC